MKIVNVKKCLVSFIAIIVLSGVQSGAHAEQGTGAAFKQELTYFEGYGRGVVTALDGMGKMGAVRKEPNIHDSKALDDILTESLPGIEITWLRPGPTPERRFLRSLAISRSERPISSFCGIGKLTEKTIAEMYGPPHDRNMTVPNTKVLIYNSPYQESDATTIEFHMKSGVLERIVWKWFIE